MTHKVTTKVRLIVGIVVVFAVMFLVIACAPNSESSSQSGSSQLGNDTAVKGELGVFDPEVEAANASGSAIEGSEEDELQQERIAGGAVGGVVSENLDPLEGITDFSEGPYVNSYGMSGRPPVITHGDNGPDCMSCHKDGGAGGQQPLSHVRSKLTNENCIQCHKAA